MIGRSVCIFQKETFLNSLITGSSQSKIGDQSLVQQMLEVPNSSEASENSDVWEFVHKFLNENVPLTKLITEQWLAKD